MKDTLVNLKRVGVKQLISTMKSGTNSLKVSMSPSGIDLIPIEPNPFKEIFKILTYLILGFSSLCFLIFII